MNTPSPNFYFAHVHMRMHTHLSNHTGMQRVLPQVLEISKRQQRRGHQDTNERKAGRTTRHQTSETSAFVELIVNDGFVFLEQANN